MITHKKVAVIGAGPSGLAALKCCIEEGIDAVCFEKSGYVGGLWHYNESHDVPSVLQTTVINSSKELSAYSDFPPPKEFPLYLHNSQMLKYFEMYAERFDLYQYVRYNSNVVTVAPNSDYMTTGKWAITIYDSLKKTSYDEVFDGVMVCTGHHTHPCIPTFKDQGKFKGEIIHTRSLKSVTAHTGKSILVIGIGNSGADAAVDLTTCTSKVYLSTRTGSWISPKSANKGWPVDSIYTNRLFGFFLKILGWRTCSIAIEYDINQRFDHGNFGLKPKHHILSQHPTLNDFLHPHLLNGKIVVKGDVESLTENGVIFEGEDITTPIDLIVLATGYQIFFPFLPPNLSRPLNNEISLYKFVFPPGLEHPTIAFIGLVQPLGAVFPVSESQSRWFAMLMTGKTKLPSPSVMEKHIIRSKAAIAQRFTNTPRHTMEVDYVCYMDELAEEYGVKPKLMKYFFTDQSLFWSCLMNPCLAYQFRLEGPKSWDGARGAILEYPDRIMYPITGRKTNAKYHIYDPLVNSTYWILIIAPAFFFMFFLFLVLVIPYLLHL